jgi:hypothetical protein
MPGRWRISKTASKSVTLKIVKADASEEWNGWITIVTVEMTSLISPVISLAQNHTI